VDTVFGSSAHYLPTDRLTENLKAELERLALVPRTELRQRGAALRQRVVDEYTYERWGQKTAAFIRSLC
jgi:hypothetical protein